MNSKSSINGVAVLPSTYTDLATLFGLELGTLFKGVLVFPAANNATAYMQATTANSSTDNTITAGQSHEYSAVNLSSIKVKGTSPDTVVLVGEHVGSDMIPRY
jgi:hypothetical protein